MGYKYLHPQWHRRRHTTMVEWLREQDEATDWKLTECHKLQRRAFVVDGGLFTATFLLTSLFWRGKVVLQIFLCDLTVGKLWLMNTTWRKKSVINAEFTENSVLPPQLVNSIISAFSHAKWLRKIWSAALYGLDTPSPLARRCGVENFACRNYAYLGKIHDYSSVPSAQLTRVVVFSPENGWLMRTLMFWQRKKQSGKARYEKREGSLSGTG